MVTSHLSMNSLHVVVYLLGLVVVCESACFFERLIISDLHNPPKGCVDKDGELHPFGSGWVKNCHDCFCTPQGISCCSKIPSSSVMVIPDKCEILVDKEACSAKLVLKSDKTKECIPV